MSFRQNSNFRLIYSYSHVRNYISQWKKLETLKTYLSVYRPSSGQIVHATVAYEMEATTKGHIEVALFGHALNILSKTETCSSVWGNVDLGQHSVYSEFGLGTRALKILSYWPFPLGL